MELTDAYKRRLNHLIVYYRKDNLAQTNDGRWQQQFFYRNGDNKAICSSATYCRLEKDKVYAEDTVYYFVAKKLGKEIRVMNDADQYLSGVIDLLYTALEQVNEEQAVEILNRILPYVSRYENIMYYEEYIWVFTVMRDYLVNIENLMSEKHFTKMCTLMSIFPYKFQELLKRFVYLYANIKEDDKLEMVLREFDFLDSDFIPNQISCISIYKRNGNSLKALQLCLQLSKILDNEENKNLLLMIYIHTFGLLADFDHEATLEYIRKAEVLIEERDFHKNRLNMLYMNVASTYLSLERYDDCIRCYLKSLDISMLLQMRAYICICHCYHMNHEMIPNKYLTLPEDEDDILNNLMYEFYRQYEGNTLAENISFITQKIVKNLTVNDDLYLGIIKAELYQLCKKVNRFKSYVQFIKMFDL